MSGIADIPSERLQPSRIWTPSALPLKSPAAFVCAVVFVVAAVQLVAAAAASGSVRAAEKLRAVWLQLRSAAGLAAGLWNQTLLRCQCQ